MRIIMNEIKKLFEFKMIIVLLFISFILYFLFASFYIEYFPNGRPALDDYNIHLQMLEDYGQSMDEEEFAHFEEVYESEVARADHYLQTNELAIDENVSTYTQFRHTDQNTNGLSNLNNHLMFEEEVDLFWELQAREGLIENYEGREDIIRNSDLTFDQRQRQRIDDIIDEGSLNSIFPGMVLENYRDYIRYVAFIVLLSVMIMLSPLYLRDKKNNMTHLQYTTKIGKSLFLKKVVAALIASFSLITLQLAVFFLFYATNKTGMFLSSNIISAFSWSTLWYDFTFMQYILLTVLGTYILGFVIALFVSFLSSISSNYLTVIAIQIPILYFIVNVLIRNLIYFLGYIYLPQYSGLLSYAGLIILSLTLITVRWRTVKNADILD